MHDLHKGIKVLTAFGRVIHKTHYMHAYFIDPIMLYDRLNLSGFLKGEKSSLGIYKEIVSTGRLYNGALHTSMRYFFATFIGKN